MPPNAELQRVIREALYALRLVEQRTRSAELSRADDRALAYFLASVDDIVARIQRK